MARDYYDESKPKKKKKETPKPQKVTKSPSVTKVNNKASNSTFMGGGSSVKKVEQRQSAAPKRQTTTTTPKRTTMTDAQYQKTYGEPRRATAQRTSIAKPEPVRRTTNHRLTAAQTQKMYGTTNPKLQTAEESRREREERRKEREERRLAAQRQKSGLNDQPTAAQKAATDRALKNTLPIAKESAKGAVYGHLTTLNDIASIKSQGNGKSREEIYDPNLAEKSRQQAEKRVKKLQAKTQETEDAIQKLTKNAKGLEKAYYGAVESGTGMLTDVGIGALTGTGQVGSLAAMYSRTYGSTRGKAQKEGATQAEDRAYAAAQAAKEVGTELMFPGAGLARGYAGKQGLKLADTAANILTKNLRGKAADLGGAGVRLIGGVLEENAEEVAGWGLDPLIKEITYGKKARTRNAQQAMKERSNALRAEIQNEDDARAAAAYLSSDDFFEQTVNAYREAGLSKKDAEEVADRMRDYLTASLTGDTDSMEQIEDEVSKKVAGSKKLEWDFDELKDTIASTTLLTAATGLPGTGMTAVKGAALRDQLGDDGVRALANTAIDFEDGEMSLKAKAMKARLDSGNKLTSTQVYDLQVGMQEQIRKDTQREESSRRMADKRIKSDNLLTPYRQNENGGIDLDEATEASYREHVSRAKDIIDGLTSETKESLTANEKVDGSKAIAGFQTGVFTIEDANTLNYSNTTVRAAFEEATGVDLGQYVVKNKDGNVNIPATNTKTKDALFAMAADNLVKSAQAETQNWMDNAKGQVVTQVSARMGASGSAVLQQALDDVDERDRSKYMMTANATDMLYQAARNMGTEWSDIAPEATRMFPGISESKLKMMYEAGLADREMANDKARGRQVRMGQALSEMGEQETATGKVFIDTEVPVKGSVIRTFTEIAKNLGADIHFVDYIYDSENNPIAGANGSYDPNTNTFYLNVATGAETNIGYIFMHETTHYLKTHAPEQYQALENLVRERWFAFNPSQMQDAIARKIEAYKRATKGQQVLTEEQALEEIIADASHDFINDPEFAKQVAEEDMGLAKAVLDSIRNALRKLRSIFASGGIDDDTHMNSLFRELDIMTEAEKLWLDAYKTAVRNSAINAVDNWQNEANEQSRLSVAEDKWNNDEKLTKAKFNSFYSAHKLTYGRATKENIDDVVEKIKSDGFISTTAIANVVPASINDYVDPKKPNLTQSKYGAKEGDVVMFVPNKYVDLKNDIIKSGYKPRDYEIVEVERDYQPYYELYSKAYDDAHNSRYSISDEDYMKAVESDDMETAQRMVDEAAAIAMPNTKLKGRWYHGTENEFTEFNFSQGGKNGTADGFGIYLTNDPEVASSYGNRMIEGYVNVTRPASALESTTLTRSELRKLIKKTVDIEAEQIAEDYDGDVNEAKFDTWISNYTDTRYAGNIDKAINEVVNSITSYNGNDMDIIQEIMVGMGIRNYDEATKFYDILTETTGIDGFETKWGDESEMADPSTPTIALAFRSEQIKSADPVTYGDDGKVIPLSERFNLENKDIRYSIAEQYDEPYMDAVNSDKLDEAQKYVDESAKLAGMRVAHRYHGTMNAGFTVFDKAYAKVGGNSGAGFYFSTEKDDSINHYADVEGADNYYKWSSLAEAIWDTGELPDGTDIADQINSYEEAVQFAKDYLNKSPGTYDVYLNYKNPYVRDYKNSTNIYDMLMDSFDESIIDRDDYEDEWEYEDAVWEAKAEHLADSLYSAVYGAYQDIENNYEVLDMPYIDEVISKITEYAFDGSLTWEEIQNGIVYAGEVEVTNPNWTDSGDATPEFARAIIENLGFDAIEDKEVSSKFGQLSREMMTDTEHIIVFKPEQIKLSDPVTYAEDGSVIPLSERFDPNNNDIRYSLPTQDSDGNILTNGQMEYFKNSLARNEAGKMQVVYHTTNKGGFTVFDPSYSDDKRSLFFASNFYVSQTYGRNANKPIDIYNDINSVSTNTLIDRVNNTTAWNIDRVATEKDFENEIKRVTLTDDDAKKYGLPKDRVEKSKEYVKTLKDMLERMRGGEDFFYSEYNAIGHSYGANSMIATKQEVIDLIQSYGKGTQGYYSCYLNLENPLVVDAHGANWSAIKYGNPTLQSKIDFARQELEMDMRTALSSIDVEFEYNDDGYPVAVNLEISKRTADGPDWMDTSYSDSMRINVGDYTDENGYYDDPQASIDMWQFVEAAIGLQVSDSSEFLNWIEDKIDFNGDIHWSSDNLTGYEWFNDSGEWIGEEGYIDEETINENYGFMPTYTTRELAEMAAAQGNDGVIIRNCRDIGGASSLKGNNPMSDIFIAFSSNQVKDINNENPTENPDIRYSFTPDDEAMSHMAHDYAYDNSYEALAYYESLIDTDTPTEVTFERAQRYIDKDIDEFYAGLTRYADGMKFDDPVLEEGRVRMARSKQDYFNSNIAKWNESWLTDGEVLDVKSVKKQVKDLVTAVMQESDTTRKYRTDLVNKAVIDMRLAYFYAKKGRTDVADALLWHSAHRMIDGVEFYADDSTYEEYKGLRDYLKTARIQLGEEYWSDADYGAFRKANFGRINLVQGSTNVDQIYAELEEMFPGLFDSEEYTTPPDQLMHIAEVLDSIQPYKEAYSSEQAAEFATDIASDLLDIMQNGKELQSVADRYKNRYEAKAKAMKARHAEAMLKVRQQREKDIKAEKAKFKEYVAKQREKKAHSKYFDSINRSYKKLTERLLTNTADKNIPEQYKKELAKVLAAFDLQTVGSKKYEARTGRKGQKSIKMANLKVTLGNIENKSGEFHVSDAVTDIIDELLGKNVGNGSNRSIEGLTIDELNSSELARIDKLLKALIHEFNTYKTVKINTKRQQVKDIGFAQVRSALEHAKTFGAGQDYYGVKGWVDRILNMDELTPAYLFRRIDPNKEGMALMYEQLEDSHDRYIRNTVQLSEWIDEIVGEYHHKGLLRKDAGVLEEWRSENYAQDFKLENGHTITLTPAQIMSVYCLSKRAQAYNHMTGAGIVVAPVSYNAKILSDLKKKAKVALPEMLTDADIKNIVSKLDPDQVKVADKLQNLMADKMAAWGNEASMNVLGIELFGEPDYFPIKSDKAGLISDLSEDQFVEAIRSFGFTKAVQPGARNAIMVEDIFDVIAQHCNNMNLYNAYSEAINDFMKVYNYRDVSEEGEYTVKQAIGHAYSQKTTNFIMSFMKDLNGNVSNGRTTGINDAFNESLARAKKASVFANIRVAAQQPTAIGRAFAVISPKYASAMLKPDRAILDEMFEHCPIAKWKSLGYYDINMGRNIEDVIMNNNNVIEEAATWAYGALDNLTWGGIWQMVKAETEDKHPKVEKGSDEYWDLCNRRMREVVAFTQVVDSPFHRSHAMRSKNFMDKLATAFGAEPTLTYNMVRDGYIRAKEMVLTGDKVGATKVFGRTMSVFVFTAGLTAAAAALADVLRGKNPDGDDDDEITLLQQWWANTLANWKDNVNLLNNIYYVKDIMSLLDGWQINNLAFQGWKYIGTGIQQLYGNPFARSKDPWWKNMMYGVGYLTGVPVKTVMTDFGAIFNKSKRIIGFETPILDSYLEALGDVSVEKDESKSDANMWTLIKEKTMDKAAEKMGYKPIEQKEEPAGEGDSAKPEEREGFLARIGLGKTEEEKAQDEFDRKASEIAEKTADLSGEAKDKKTWSYVTTYLKSQNGDKPLNEFIQEGDYSTVNEYRRMYEEAGGNTEYFDQRIFDTSKSAMKKTIVYDPTDQQIDAQDKIKGYLLTHGMDESELSEMVYKSDTAKDMKVAFRLNDKDLMLETLEPLVRAGLTYDDLERLWENRNRMQISSYKGRYKDKLKSTGNFIWPTDGQITSYFGYRNAPTAGASSNHPAIDIGAPMGTDVVAADGGVVIYAGTNGGYGNSVGIKHDNGMVTYYNHLSAWNVKVGDTVAQGQQIANVGSTGISTGPHLDFKILDGDGEPVDPLKYLASRS